MIATEYLGSTDDLSTGERGMRLVELINRLIEDIVSDVERFVEVVTNVDEE